MKKIFALTLVFVVMACVLSACQTSTTDSKNGGKDNSEESKKTEYSVGETAEYEDIQWTLTKVKTSKGDGEFITPDKGKEYVLCFFEIKNNSSEKLSLSSMMMFSAYCDDESIDQDIMALQTPEAKSSETLDGDVAAGKTMKGVIAYEVPKKWKKIEIQVEPDVLSDDTLKFIANNK